MTIDNSDRPGRRDGARSRRDVIALVVLSDMTEEKKNGNGKDRSRFF